MRLIPLLIPILFTLLELALHTGCAQVIAPTGGPRDSIAPVLDTFNSTPNFQTKFNKQPIILTFQEFIALKDAFSQVVISPPVNTFPEIEIYKLRGVRLEFAEEEVLRPNATYTINFGESIRDFTEGNVAPVRFVFSTGDYIDSLAVSGNVVDAYTGKPVDKVLVLLYDNLADTAVQRDRPFYFARTDAQGAFRIENVKSDTFQVLALEDLNLNYQYDLPDEKIGFPDAPILVTDSTPGPLAIRFSQPEQELRLLQKQFPFEGLVKLTYSGDPGGISWTAEPPLPGALAEVEADTFRLWYPGRQDTGAWTLLIGADTLAVKPGKERTGKLALSGRTAGTMHPSKPLDLLFTAPISRITDSLIQLTADTLPVDLQTCLWEIDNRHLRLQCPWAEGVSHQLLLLPGAVTDLFGVSHDTLRVSFRPGLAKEYGNIKLTVTGLDPAKGYLVELFLRDQVYGSQAFAGAAEWTQTFSALPTGQYSIRIVEDLNLNGRWDPGSFPEKRQPEEVRVHSLENLRPNWDLESTVEYR